MLDVVVTCLPHGDDVSIFPQVRGYYLAKHLARSGLRAEFRQLPLPDVRCKVLISSEYQADRDYFEQRLVPRLTEVAAARMYCIVAFSLRREPDHFSRFQYEWFGARGGVLLHLPADELGPYEHWIGVGIDREVVDVALDQERNRVLFDFPKAPGREDASDRFDPQMLAAVRAGVPDCIPVGSGPSDSPIRDFFDDWIEYGQPHAKYTRAALSGVFAFVPGWGESVGLPLAEAQVTGACIVASQYRAPEWMLCPEADVPHAKGDGDSLVAALSEAKRRNPALIRAQAAARFAYFSVCKRTRKAIGL